MIYLKHNAIYNYKNINSVYSLRIDANVVKLFLKKYTYRREKHQIPDNCSLWREGGEWVWRVLYMENQPDVLFLKSILHKFGTRHI